MTYTTNKQVVDARRYLPSAGPTNDFKIWLTNRSIPYEEKDDVLIVDTALLPSMPHKMADGEWVVSYINLDGKPLWDIFSPYSFAFLFGTEENQQRGSGRTLSIIKQMSPGDGIIIYNHRITAYMRDLMRKVHGPAADEMFIHICLAAHDVRRIEHIQPKGNIFVDHAFWELGNRNATGAIQAMLERRNGK